MRVLERHTVAGLAFLVIPFHWLDDHFQHILTLLDELVNSDLVPPEGIASILNILAIKDDLSVGVDPMQDQLARPAYVLGGDIELPAVLDLAGGDPSELLMVVPEEGVGYFLVFEQVQVQGRGQVSVVLFVEQLGALRRALQNFQLPVLVKVGEGELGDLVQGVGQDCQYEKECEPAHSVR